MTAALEGGEWSVVCPGRTLSPGKKRYPFYRRLGGSQGRSRRVENLVPTGIRSRTVHPVVSRYTGCATWPTMHGIWNYQNNLQDSTTSHVGSFSLNTTVCFHTKYFTPFVQALNEQPLERSRPDTTGCGRKNTPIWEGHSFRWGACTVVGSTSLNNVVRTVFSVYHGVVGRTSSLYC